MWTPDMGFDRLERMVERDMESRYGGFILNGCWDDDEDEMVEIDVVDDEDGEICTYCGDWDPKEQHIYYVFDGKVRSCCENCFFGMIEEDLMYEEAIMILRNRLGDNTGILAVDLFADRMIAELEKANQAQLVHDCAMYAIEKLRKVGA